MSDEPDRRLTEVESQARQAEDECVGEHFGFGPAFRARWEQVGGREKLQQGGICLEVVFACLGSCKAKRDKVN